MIGETVGGRYKISRLLGQGGMGAVYEARHKSTARRVALKLITEKAAHDEEMLARFKVEAQAAGVIESEHIAQVLDMDHDEDLDVPFLAMELLEGEDLQQLLDRLGALPVDLAARVGLQACRGLSRAHASKVIHRDIKPANIFLATRDDGTRIVKLLDFGIAKIRGDQDFFGISGAGGRGVITTTGTLMGSPMYMSPEQTNGLKKVDHRTDVWALGIVLYEALAGHTPFHDAEGVGDLIVSLCTKHRPLRSAAPWVDPELAAIIDRAQTIDIADRYQSIDEMLEDLTAYVGDAPDITEDMLMPLSMRTRASIVPDTVAAKRTTTPEIETAQITNAAVVTSSPAPPPMRRRPWVLLAAAAIPVIGAAGFIATRADDAPTRGDVAAEPAAASASGGESPSEPTTTPEPEPAPETDPAPETETTATRSGAASASVSAEVKPRSAPHPLRPAAPIVPKRPPVPPSHDDPLDEM